MGIAEVAAFSAAFSAFNAAFSAMTTILMESRIADRLKPSLWLARASSPGSNGFFISEIISDFAA